MQQDRVDAMRYADWAKFREDAPNCHSLLTFLTTFTVVQGASIVGLVQFAENKFFAFATYSVLFAITLSALAIIMILAHKDQQQNVTRYFDKSSCLLAIWVAIVSTILFLFISLGIYWGFLDISQRESFQLKEVELSGPVTLESLANHTISLNGKPLDSGMKRPLTQVATAFRSGWGNRGTQAAIDVIRDVYMKFDDYEAMLGDNMKEEIEKLEAGSPAFDVAVQLREDTKEKLRQLQESIAKGVAALEPNEQVFMYYQTYPFEIDYRDTEFTLVTQNCTVSNKIAFAFHDDGHANSRKSEPVFRLLQFTIGSQGEETNRLVVPKPDRRERIGVILSVVPKGQEGPMATLTHNNAKGA